MEITVKGLKIFYERSDGEGLPIVILHGWGASTAAMKGIFDFLCKRNRNVVSLDFPGFGKSDMPPETFDIYEYADLTAEFLRLIDIQNPIILGHSFGGRVAIILENRKIASKIILVDSAGVKPKFSFKKRFSILLYKIKRRLGLKTDGMGSSDYNALSKNMRQVFVRVVNQHLNAEIKKIKVPTLIVWGEKDDQTPLYMARYLNKKIPSSGLCILKGCGHFSFSDNFVGFLAIINSFIS